ncbi:hypothetical protein A9Q76_03935 [Arcobacter sp. 31_11_sub10_T18]|nr:hypothetical protein A9Q76_03935 [Arcobacter sp. 31_11_sub10_T18]
MNYLRYSSDEMFSSTELIRKSKSIFDKLNKKQIEKAIILRDGKPGFMLLDFATYEKIMREFEKLNTKVSKKEDDLYLSLEDIEIQSHEETVQTSINNEEAIETPISVELEAEALVSVEELEVPTSSILDTTAPEISQEEEKQLSEITQIEEMVSDEINDEELLEALAEIEKINVPNNDSPRQSEDISDDDLELGLEEDLESTETQSDQSAEPLKEFWDK